MATGLCLTTQSQDFARVALTSVEGLDSDHNKTVIQLFVRTIDETPKATIETTRNLGKKGDVPANWRCMPSANGNVYCQAPARSRLQTQGVFLRKVIRDSQCQEIYSMLNVKITADDVNNIDISNLVSATDINSIAGRGRFLSEMQCLGRKPKE